MKLRNMLLSVATHASRLYKSTAVSAAVIGFHLENHIDV